MVLELNESFTTVLLVTDENGNPVSGKTISYRIFDEVMGVFATGSMTELGVYGIYYKTWTPDTAGYWIFEAYYSGTDFKFYDIKMYPVEKGEEKDIELRLGNPLLDTLPSITAKLGNPAQSLGALLEHATYGLSALDSEIDALENKIKASPSVDSIFFKSGGATCPTGKSLWDALGNPTADTLTSLTTKLGNPAQSLGALLEHGTYGLSALDTEIDAIQTDLGDFSARTNLKSLLAVLGIPDVAGKDLYTLLITDRLDSATFGLSQLDTELDALENKLKASPSVDSILFKSGGAVCPTGKSIWDAIGNPTADTLTSLTAKLGNPTTSIGALLESGTYGLSALKTLIDAINADLGDFSGRTTLKSLMAILGWVDNVNVRTLEQRLGTGYQLTGSIETDLATIDGIVDTLKGGLVVTSGTTGSNGAVDGTTLVTGLADAADFWNGATVIIGSGTYKGQAREITDFAGGTITVAPAFGGQIVSAVSFYIISFRSSENDIDSIVANIGNFQGRANQKTILAALGIPDAVSSDLYTLLVTNRLDSGTFGLNALLTALTALENKIKTTPSVTSIFANGSGFAVAPLNKSIWDVLGDATISMSTLSTALTALENKIKATPSVTSIFANGSGFAIAPTNKSIWDALGNPTGDTLTSITAKLGNPAQSLGALLEHGTYGLNALLTAITAVNTDVGDWSARVNLQSLLASLGIPDTAGKSLYTCLITDRLDSATFGLAAIKAYVDSLELWLGDPSGHTLTTITAKLGNNATAIGVVSDKLNALIRDTGALSGTPTTNFFATNLTEATDDHYNGCVIVMTSGNLIGQASIIVDYDGTTKSITIDPAFIETPAAANTFLIFSNELGGLRTGSKALEQIFDLIDQLFNLKRVGDTLTTDGTEQNIWIQDSPAFPFKPIKLLIDTTAHTATETVVIRQYVRMKSGGNYIEFDELTLAGAQDPLGVSIDLLPNLYGIKLTIEKTAGTNRAYDLEVFFEER